MNAMPFLNMLVQGGVGEPGKSLFLSMMPTECQLGILLRPPLTGTKIDYELPGYYKTTLQVVARSRAGDYELGAALIEKAVKCLTIKTDTQVETLLVRHLRPRHKPVSFPVSQGNLVEFSVTMDLCFNEED